MSPLLGGFALFGSGQVWGDDAPFLFRLWGLPLLAIGLCVFVGHLAVDAFLRGRSAYGVSTRRVLLFRRPPFGRFRSFEIGHLPLLELTERADGRGTIRFDLDAASLRQWPDRYDARSAGADAAADSFIG